MEKPLRCEAAASQPACIYPVKHPARCDMIYIIKRNAIRGIYLSIFTPPFSVFTAAAYIKTCYPPPHQQSAQCGRSLPGRNERFGRAEKAHSGAGRGRRAAGLHRRVPASPADRKPAGRMCAGPRGGPRGGGTLLRQRRRSVFTSSRRLPPLPKSESGAPPGPARGSLAGKRSGPCFLGRAQTADTFFSLDAVFSFL